MNLIGYIDDYGRGWVKGDAHNSIRYEMSHEYHMTTVQFPKHTTRVFHFR